MDKSDIAIGLALLSACFTAWQSYSSHVVAKINRAAAKRKPPVFEIIATEAEFVGWSLVRIVARNFEPVTVRITRIQYAKRGVVFLPRDAQWENVNTYPPIAANSLPLEKAQRSLLMNRAIGAFGQQASLSAAPELCKPTEFLSLFAHGPFDPKHLEVIWEWADGQKQ